MSGCSKREFHAPVFAEFFEIMTCELGAVVCDDFLWNPEPYDHMRPYELSDLEVGYSAECLFFDPF